MLWTWCKKQKETVLPLSNSDSLTPCFLLQQLGAVFPLVFLSHHTKSRDRPGNKIAATSFIHKSAWILGTAKWAIVVISHSLPPCSQNVLFLLLLWEQEQGKNNLELPFPSPLQIKYNGKKKTGGCQILKGWWFFFELSTGALSGAAGFWVWILSMGCVGCILKDSRC